MKTYSSRGGSLPERPYYEIKEIERICTDELRTAELYPDKPCAVRIDRFIEKRFGVQVTYEELPAGLLGFTRFGPKGVEAVVVSNALDAEGTRPAERRLRTTLAHEGGHGLLHAHLFALASSPALLFNDSTAADSTRILCREGGVAGLGPERTGGYDGRWWEFQANQAMGALLLPRRLVDAALQDLVVEQGMLGRVTLPARSRDAAVRRLADLFDVNPVVVRHRLEGLYPAEADRQLTL